MKHFAYLLAILMIVGCHAGQAPSPNQPSTQLKNSIPLSQFEKGPNWNHEAHWVNPKPHDWTSSEREIYEEAIYLISNFNGLITSDATPGDLFVEKGGEAYVKWLLLVFSADPSVMKQDPEDDGVDYGFTFTEKAISEIAAEKPCPKAQPLPKNWETDDGALTKWGKKVYPCLDVLFHAAPNARCYFLEKPELEGQNAIVLVQQLSLDEKEEYALPINHVRLHFLKQGNAWWFDGREILE